MEVIPIISRLFKYLLPEDAHGMLRSLYRSLRGQRHGASEVNLVHWDVYLDDPRLDPRLGEMLSVFIDGQEAATTSAYWSVLCRKNVAQLLDKGYENFKQTVALNYFTWIVDREDPQALFLQSCLPEKAVNLAKKRAAESKKHTFITKEQSEFYNLLTYLIWAYAEKTVGTEMMARLSEPGEGNPLSAELAGRNISQDIANSALEYYSVSQGLPDIQSVKSIIELGGGYGRTAYVFLKLLPNVRYVLVDIPPALYIAERYITGQFADRKIFPYRPFRNFSDVAEEFNRAQIAFLMPDQLSLLPDRSTDLFLAIDCLHEMRPEQIKRYYETVNRLSDSFYQKCWKKTKIPYDDITLTKDDYPFPANWQRLFFRDCQVQTTYFEAMFNIVRS